jgi:hypothetical protein
MNLGKLLSAGKSIFGGQGKLSYRENKRIYLPRFNDGKNPFAPRPAESMLEPVAETKSVAATPAGAPPVIKPAPMKPARASSWKDKLNPFRASEPVAPSMVGAVQAELSLDAVKVVRNDLADADIEVVPVKSQTVSMPEAPVLPPARHSWEFLGERLVKID